MSVTRISFGSSKGTSLVPVKNEAPRHNRLAVFKELPVGVLERVTSDLKSGVSYADVIAYIHSLGYWTKYPRTTCVSRVRRYHKFLIMGSTTEEKGTSRKKLKEIDAIKELTKLVHMQRRRLSKIYSREKAAPLLMDSVSKEIQITSKLLGQLMGAQFETGKLQRAAKPGTTTTATIDMTDPSKIQLQFTTGLMEKLDALDVEFEEIKE